jgi:ABC-type multidrug transport system fused ATPase/permease subunit
MLSIRIVLLVLLLVLLLLVLLLLVLLLVLLLLVLLLVLLLLVLLLLVLLLVLLLLVLLLVLSISSMLRSMLRTAVQQRRKRIRQRRQRRALQHRQSQQQPIERRRKRRCARQPRRYARSVVGEDVEHNRRCDGGFRNPRRQRLASPILERRECQRQIRQFDAYRRQPPRQIAARRRKRALDAQRAWGAQQQYCQCCEYAKSHVLLPLLSQHNIFFYLYGVL